MSIDRRKDVEFAKRIKRGGEVKASGSRSLKLEGKDAIEGNKACRERGK
jgi:hypothetical protein